jgi:hypothetical protein
MKLLQNKVFQALSSALTTQREDVNMSGTVESYSCKMTGNEKKLYKNIYTEGKNPTDLQLLSPSESEQQYHRSLSNSGSWSPLSDDNTPPAFVSVIDRKMLFKLTSTLNAAFPDYDFSHANSEEFSREHNLGFVVNNANSNLSTALGEDFAALNASLWKSIDDEICLRDCQIYSYNPDMESDPFGEDGCLWSFNYLFYNKEMKRIVFFNCHGGMNNTGHFGDQFEEMEDQYEMDWSENDYQRRDIQVC